MKPAVVRCLCIFSCIFAPLAVAATIALDVGHHHAAPGATSARGRPEFAFNLDLALEIENALRARGYLIQVIGADGRMKSLWRRPRAARGAALFVSVHHDSTQAKYQTTWLHAGAEQRYSDRFEGFSLFVSRENPAWRTALRCASAIGAALVKAGFRPSLYHAHPELGENRPFADKDNGVHYFDHLAVLRHAQMPALLLEAGVIVNRDEEIKLGDKKTQKLIAGSVATGIAGCFSSGER